MKQKASKTSKMSSTEGKPPSKGRSALKIGAVLLGAGVLFAAGWFSMDARITATRSRNTSAAVSQSAHSQVQAPDFSALIGQWQRPDGGYILDIRGVSADGRLDAAYFNPNPIYVARAEAKAQGDAIHIFVELQDKGYPGATYQLLYQRNQQTLTGLYYQPAAGGSFDVYFLKRAQQ